jgi:hypothetical protein
MTLEISLETRAVKLLLSRGANPIKYGQDGLPDRMVLWGKGRHFWIEFKKFRTGRLRAMQVWKKYLNRIGDDVYVIDTTSRSSKSSSCGRRPMALRPPSALRDYQLTGIGRMIANAHVGQAALLKPGLGKTVIAQTAVTRLRPKRTLVAGPAQVVESKVWSQEAMEWEHLCGLRIVELTGTPDQRAVKLMLDADIFVVSYDNLIWLTDEVERDFFDAAVYDELSKMKHPGTQDSSGCGRGPRTSPSSSA